MPNDLIANGRNFYTEINFLDYAGGLLGGGLTIGQAGYNLNLGSGLVSVSNLGSIKLPLPRKINDNLVLNWGEISATSALTFGRADKISSSAQYQLGSALSGYAINPNLFVYFQRPNFREFSLQWALAPRNEKESQTIKEIANLCRNAASPEWGTLLLGYPLIASIKLFPGDKNAIGDILKFKPCVITSISVDQTPNGPSVFESGAPTLVTLTMNIKEIKMWYRGEFV